MLGMFLGGIPEAAVSASMLTRAGYSKKFIFGVWSLVLIVGMLAAVIGKQFIGNSDTLLAVFFEAVADWCGFGVGFTHYDSRGYS